MRPRALLPLLLAGAGCAPATVNPMRGPAPTPATVTPGSLAEVVDSVTGTAPLDRTHWGIEVTAPDGRVILRRNAEHLFTAASNTKLATIAAALELLGPEYRWTTEFEARDVVGGTASALVVRGSGDPSLSDHFHPHGLAPLDSLADSLYAAGVRRIAGPLVVDPSAFDSVQAHPAWENFDLDWYYGAPVAAFAVMEGAYPVVMTPGRIGEPARVEVLAPTGLVAVDARVMTVAGSRGWNDDLRRIPGTDSVVFRGEIGTEAGPDTSWIAQDEPGRFAARALAMALARRGIAVGGPVVVSRPPATAPNAADASLIRVAWRSAPLSDVARIALEQSDNWVTEQVLKTLGAREGNGSWSGGTAVVERFLTERAGADSSAMYLRDGSGLTSQTLLTPAAIGALLRYALSRPWAGVYRHAMVSPGEPEGTLEDRLAGYEDRVAAKTGTLRHVNALSGYAVRRGGDLVVFSILTNASGRPASEVRRAVDRIVVAILESGS